MSPYFMCIDCDRVLEVKPKTDTCPHCQATNGRIMSDEEFRRHYSKGAIKLIDPSTGKPMK